MELTQKTQQTLSAQQLQSMKILQMGAQELRQYVETLMLENPVLEHDEAAPEPAGDPQPYDRLEWAAANDRQNAQYYASDEDRDPMANVGGTTGGDRLTDDLFAQFGGLRLEPEVAAAIRFLVARLGADGWLEEDIEAQAAEAGISTSLFARALDELQAAEPAGVGARSLEECLRLQIARQAGDHSLAERIVAAHLPDLACGRLAQIAKQCGAPEEEVRAACALIRRLNPHPCAGFAGRERPRYVIPDVRILDTGDGFEVVPNQDMLPRLRLNPYYLQLMRDTADRETRDYLLKKANQAKWVVHSIEQRQSTVLGCVRCIAGRQEAFLRSRGRSLRALSMQEVAQQLGVHESTVSRAAREKYVQAPSGVYPLGIFFSRALGEGDTSLDAARKLLKSLIDGEGEPLSDQKLCEEMQRQGCAVSRRTVTKYRLELGIPSAQARKARR